MMYFSYQTQADMMAPLRAMARMARPMIDHGWGGTPLLRRAAAALEMIERAGLTHGRPSYELDTIAVDGRDVPVVEEATLTLPFGTLLRFKKEGVTATQPRVMVVAPLSGHFATLLRGTVKTLLPEHDVYITDWHNARDVSLDDGRFGFDDYVDYLIKFLETLGPGAHVVAVCQPCVQALAATAIMAEDNNPAVPRSLTLMAGPIDCRLNPTKVNELATTRPIEWFEKTLISTVPMQFAGARRRVYPGFMQVTAFMSLNPERHVRAHLDLYDNLVRGDRAKAEVTKVFYDEYFAVLDLPAEFYLETVQTVFQEYHLALGKLQWRGRTVNPKAIRRTALLTVEGERDDICSVGQTLAAHDLCTSIRPALKRHHLQPGVGHYGVFSGSRWNSQIYPLVRNVILSTD